MRTTTPLSLFTLAGACLLAGCIESDADRALSNSVEVFPAGFVDFCEKGFVGGPYDCTLRKLSYQDKVGLLESRKQGAPELTRQSFQFAPIEDKLYLVQARVPAKADEPTGPTKSVYGFARVWYGEIDIVLPVCNMQMVGTIFASVAPGAACSGGPVSAYRLSANASEAQIAALMKAYAASPDRRNVAHRIKVSYPDQDLGALRWKNLAAPAKTQ